MDTRYELISETPIKVTVNAEAAFATISWSYKATFQEDPCNQCSIIGSKSLTIEITPNTDCKNPKENKIANSITWNGITIDYEITQLKPICPTPCEEDMVVTNELIEDRIWVTPYDIYCNRESNNTMLHYEFLQTITLCNEVISKEIIKKDIPINITCECNQEGSNIVEGEKQTEEGFIIGYSANCIVNSECNCDNFEFIEETCDCNDFVFTDVECNCNDFEFTDVECDCNDFEFIQPEEDCGCGTLNINLIE